MVLFSLINLSLSREEHVCALAGGRYQGSLQKQAQHPVVLPGAVGVHLGGSERRCCVRQDAKKALKPLPVPQGTLSCILYILLYSCILPCSPTTGDERDRWTLGLIQHSDFY